MAEANEQIEQRVIEIVRSQMGLDKGAVTRDSGFAEDLGCDSLDNIELIMECEDEFGLGISDEDREKIRTVGQAIDYIASRCS